MSMKVFIVLTVVGRTWNGLHFSEGRSLHVITRSTIITLVLGTR